MQVTEMTYITQPLNSAVRSSEKHLNSAKNTNDWYKLVSVDISQLILTSLNPDKTALTNIRKTLCATI